MMLITKFSKILANHYLYYFLNMHTLLLFVSFPLVKRQFFKLVIVFFFWRYLIIVVVVIC